MKPVFVRFGGLSLVTQKGYDPRSKHFHSPPARRGVYAFPLKAIELFLLGGNYGVRSFDQKRQCVRHFTHTGNLWHHLEAQCPPNEILARKGSWVKTSVQCWQRAFGKESLQNRYIGFGGRHGRITSINEPFRAGVSGIVSKDHYEVFLDEKVG
jgi:hypothetical protein